MGLKHLSGWSANAENKTAAVCSSACGTGDPKPSACGSACGAGDKK